MKNILIKVLGLSLISFASIADTASNVKQGQVLFDQWCAHCHDDGQVATVYLSQRYKGSVSGKVEERNDFSQEYVRMRIRTQIPGMPAFRPTELSDDEVQHLAEYLTRNNP